MCCSVKHSLGRAKFHLPFRFPSRTSAVMISLTSPCRIHMKHDSHCSLCINLKNQIVSQHILQLLILILTVCSLPAQTPLVKHSDGWRYRKGTSAPQANWKTAADASLDG